ncbi:hypothetical protein A3I99_03895 [Candidatus Kaiserbacteria bacterium RIFCSPLOWO2_02_FULL_45_11b]|uniref:histidine kinase n=1 Tax=Candidatus Kaiserbacteria bacterium RIFCSPLOWO2_12_FULL_45_26 TaxID=1798525 RepID=A0A1F6FH83_9BACT|nr:MAG: hypothetical protein A2929_02775 [Candidatus Kaiserbacteria bacterium RIFCSPLOWO2_01_FULL_45_25]OGG83730.1 MAG: hypothetical protein A3I99_03895 [Candidatus Kaiserbacteria bacterium RIFCSPLOWO2_02_FULL_45_11b]OGG85225.1 MAG: hypothetical protein A3G90_04175 [Candidatus Kaiserbacteria bacterium RIFCSPLOWO2_12_FULL_45_26]
MEEFSAAIYSTKEVALNIYEVTFKLSTPLFFEPGQSIELCLSHAAADDKRSDCQKLPIVSSVDSKNLLTVVLRDTNSSFERSLLDLPVGDKVLIRGPFGIFCLPNKPQQEVVFIAGGIGIASFMSMIQVSLNRNIKTPVTLLYANVNSEQALYVKELEEIAKQSDAFKLKLVSGDISSTLIKDSVENITDKQWFVAGASNFVLSVLYQLREMGVPESNILLEEISGYGSVMNHVNQRVVREDKPKQVSATTTVTSGGDTSNLEQIIADMKLKEAELENTKKAILNILEDLDEEKKAVERRVEERTAEIKREKEKLHQVTKNIKNGVFLLDSEGVVIFVNEGLYQLLDLNQEEILMPEVLEEILAYYKDTNFKESLTRCLNGEVFTLPEVETQGKIFEIFFNNLQVKTDGKDDVNYFVLITDITDAKLLERSKSELVAVASHQLRTPLTAVRGNIEMLIDESYGPLNEQQHELLSDVDISTARLIGMVNDMLDITKIERGNLDMVLEYVSVKETVDSICSDLADYAKRRGVVIEINIPEGINVYGDKSRVRQVMQNLIDNAIKYSKGTGVLKVTGNVEGNDAKINFKDNGQGIPKIEQSKIFNRFYRASNVKNNSSSGSGLGLYIVKSIVEQLHGNIRFESEENVGTTFFVTLPTSEQQ